MATREGGGGTGTGNRTSGARWNGSGRREKESEKGREINQRLIPTALID